jgi:beta-glucosidase
MWGSIHARPVTSAPPMAPLKRLFAVCAAASVLIALAAPAAGAAGRCGQHPWCDTTLSPDRRAELVLAELTLPEKQQLLWGDDQFGVANPPGGQFHTGTNDGVPRLDIPTLYFSDGPVGPRQGAGATSMPAPLGLAASFDPALARAAGSLVADEVKAKGNDVVFAPTVNIMRNPRAGRTFEAYGEDTYLAARQAVGWIKGAQSRGVIAEVKHFAANNQEKDRMQIDERIDERTLREIYLPQFEAAVKEGGSGTVMCAYNQVNSQFACENNHLLMEILKKEWGFPGFVVADYPAAHDTAASLKNGLDFEPFGATYSPANTTSAIVTGKASESDVNEHVRRILRTMFAFGVFDREGYKNDDSQIPVQAHAKEAQRIEEGGITLLRNRHAVLPLRPAKVKKIALIGSDAEKFKSGGGSSNVTPLATVNARQGIEGRAGSRMQVTYDNTDDPEHSAQTAKDADVAVVVVSDTATEGEDAPCIAIDCTDDKVVVGLTTMDGKKRNLDEVITAVAKANKRTVVVMETSGPVLTPWRGLVAGIVEAWYPGEYGGAAIARVLFGDVDPGGRLPATFPQREADLPTAGDPLSYPGVNNTVVYKEGVFVGYRWFDARHLKPAYPFGFGMSYTRFRYSGLRIKGNKVSAVVRNVGRRTGSDVVQLYIHMPHPSKDVRQPPRQLKGFRKLTLRRGQAKRVVFTLKSRSFSYWDVSRHDWAIAPGCYRIYVGRSSRDLKLGGKRALAGGSCRR